MKLTAEIEAEITQVLTEADAMNKRFKFTDETLCAITEEESIRAEALKMLTILREISNG